MWVIELNFVGLRFTHRVDDRRRPVFRFTPRTFGWRSAQVRHTPAA